MPGSTFLPWICACAVEDFAYLDRARARAMSTQRSRLTLASTTHQTFLAVFRRFSLCCIVGKILITHMNINYALLKADAHFRPDQYQIASYGLEYIHRQYDMVDC